MSNKTRKDKKRYSRKVESNYWPSANNRCCSWSAEKAGLQKKSTEMEIFNYDEKNCYRVWRIQPGSKTSTAVMQNILMISRDTTALLKAQENSFPLTFVSQAMEEVIAVPEPKVSTTTLHVKRYIVMFKNVPRHKSALFYKG